MDRTRKRAFHDDSPSRPERAKKTHQHPRSPSSSPQRKRPTFTSYFDVPNLPPKIKLLCEIIATTPSAAVEEALVDTGVRVTTEDVEQVLKLSYDCPGTAVKFFRWAGGQFNDKHSPYAWNLVVDLLGKNSLYEAMWDAIKSMKQEGLLSLATFASVFSSYVGNGRVDEAIMTFEVMDQYGCPRDVVALNSLLSAICREGRTSKAREFFYIAKDKIRPDADTYAILLEGWENEGSPANATKTFEEMVAQCGWDPANVPAYDAFLTTLLNGRDGIRETMKFFDVMKDKRCFPGMKFFRAALEHCFKDNNDRMASHLWEAMMGSNGSKPDTQMYNDMIALQCYHNNTDAAYKYLDEMIMNGVFPDSHTYNNLFQFLIKGRKLREASAIFNEMVKNEVIPKQSTCTSAIRVYLDLDDPRMAIKIWKFMIANEMSGLEEAGNMLICRLNRLEWLSEARKYAEDMIERRIKLDSSTLSKLKQSYSKLGKAYTYEELLRKWKSR